KGPHHGRRRLVAAGLQPQHRQGARFRRRCRRRLAVIVRAHSHRAEVAARPPARNRNSAALPTPLRLGTRRSALAMTQSGMMQRAVALALGAAEDSVEDAVVLVPITTTGDRVQDRRLMDVGGKALFPKEIEQALTDGRIDLPAHSMKDGPTEPPPG